MKSAPTVVPLEEWAAAQTPEGIAAAVEAKRLKLTELAQHRKVTRMAATQEKEARAATFLASRLPPYKDGKQLPVLNWSPKSGRHEVCYF